MDKTWWKKLPKLKKCRSVTDLEKMREVYNAMDKPDKITEILEAFNNDQSFYEDRLSKAHSAILSLINEKIEGMRKFTMGYAHKSDTESRDKYIADVGFNQALDQVKSLFKEER